MRVSTWQLTQSSIDTLLGVEKIMQKTQNQLSTGKRILTPADDPAGSAQSLSLTEVIGTNEQYQFNIIQARNRLTLEESTLEAAMNQIQRARELLITALNDPVGTANRLTIAKEVENIRVDVTALANTKDASDEYIFAGHQGLQQPFVTGGGGVVTYAGDQGQRFLQVSPTRYIEAGDSGYETFVNIPAFAGGKQDLFATLNTIVADLQADNPTDNSLKDLDYALDSLIEVRTLIGTRQRVLDNQETTNADYLVGLTAARSSIEDLDFAEAISRFNMQSVGLEAAQKSYARVQGLSLFNYL